MSTRNSEARPKTGNWRPFRPAGMSDGAWKTILLLHRGEAMMKADGKEARLSQFFRQVRKREWAAQDFFGDAVMPKSEECCAREDLVKGAGRREAARIEREFEKLKAVEKLVLA